MFIKNESNSEEIKRIYESLLEIRRNTIENKEKIEKIAKDSNNDHLRKRINDLYLEVEKLGNVIDENLKEEANDDGSIGNIKEFVKNISCNLKILTEIVKNLIKK